MQKEIINSGESVALGLFAEVSWIAGTVIEFKVILQVFWGELLQVFLLLQLKREFIVEITVGTMLELLMN